ncbi:MAG TPA: peptide ABC transporter substrate-binding protein [Candidatus Paceibacterota bacterium]
MLLALAALISLISVPFSTYYHFTKPTPDYGGTLVEGLLGNLKHLNPLLVQSNDADKDLVNLVYSGLVRFGTEGKLENNLAQSYEISEDGLTYTFKIKENITWHDGYPITADDIVFTIVTAQNEDYASTQRILWQGVEVSKTDKLTVVFKLKNKYAQFLDNATLGILPQHIWQNIKPANFSLSEFNLKPVGSGPYKFSKIKRDSYGQVKSFELEAFDKYHEGRPFISRIIFKMYPSETELIQAYNNGDIKNFGSISATGLNSIRFLGQLNLNSLKLPRYFAVFLNQNHSEQLSDKNVRLALSHATDKDSIISDVLSGKASRVDSPMLPGILDIPAEGKKFNFDPNLANQILDNSGWTLSGDTRQKSLPSTARKDQTSEDPLKLRLELTTSDWPELVRVANQLKEQWRSIGFDVTIKSLPLGELQQTIKERSYDALLFGEVLALDPDPFSFWHSSQKKDPGLNLALYDNKDADKILEEARQTLNPSSRLMKYNELQNIIIEDIPAIFLYSPDYIYSQSKEIKGNTGLYISSPSERFNKLGDWYIETKRVVK